MAATEANGIAIRAEDVRRHYAMGHSTIRAVDGVEADNGKIYVIYDRGRQKEREILMATFTEDDVRQGKCVTAQCQLKMLVNKAGE